MPEAMPEASIAALGHWLASRLEEAASSNAGGGGKNLSKTELVRLRNAEDALIPGTHTSRAYPPRIPVIPVIPVTGATAQRRGRGFTTALLCCGAALSCSGGDATVGRPCHSQCTLSQGV